MPIDKKWIILIVPILFVVLLLVLFIRNNEEDGLVIIDVEDLTETSVEQEQTTNTTDELILVDLKGEVLNPGVYEMNEGDRVIDVIEQAGGFTADANEAHVNLAQRLHDEMVIIVPKLIDDDVEFDSFTQTGSSNNDGGGVRVNYASKEELMTLPGIGEQKALNIIQYREEHGPFRVKEDLLNISGIGEKTLERFQDQIIVP